MRLGIRLAIVLVLGVLCACSDDGTAPERATDVGSNNGGQLEGDAPAEPSQSDDDGDEGEDPEQGPRSSSTSETTATALKKICAEANATCTDWVTAMRWWGREALAYRSFDQRFTETIVVFSDSGHGLQSDPAARSSLLILFYLPREVDGEDFTSGDEVFDAGGIVVQLSVRDAAVAKPIEEDLDIEDDGYRRTRVNIGDRERVFTETTDPPAGVDGFTVSWTLPLSDDDERVVYIEALSSSDAVTKDDLFAFVTALEGP